jgi:hypothetical protein
MFGRAHFARSLELSSFLVQGRRGIFIVFSPTLLFWVMCLCAVRVSTALKMVLPACAHRRSSVCRWQKVLPEIAARIYRNPISSPPCGRAFTNTSGLGLTVLAISGIRTACLSFAKCFANKTAKPSAAWAQPTALASSPPPGVVLVRYASEQPGPTKRVTRHRGGLCFA